MGEVWAMQDVSQGSPARQSAAAASGRDERHDARQDSRTTAAVVAQIEAAGSRAVAIEADLGDPATPAALFDTAAERLGPNVVQPPVTDTGWVTAAVREFVASSDRHVHVARPEEVARVIAYLASDDARLITANEITLR